MLEKFNDLEINEIQKIIKRYPEKKAALMPILWIAQKKYGYLSEEVQAYVAEFLELSLSHVNGVASFYTMYFKKPMGKYHVQVCTNISCMARGAEKILEKIQQKLNLGIMDVSDDGLFSLEEVECMGACSGAPMIAINEDFFENVNEEKVDKLIDNLKK